MSDRSGLKIADLQKQVADQVVQLMEEEGLNWTRRWRTPSPAQNGATGHIYSGSNILTTAIAMMVHGWTDPRFLSFKQVRALGGSVKGQKGTPIIFFGTFEKKDDAGNVERKSRFAKVTYIWNVEQVADLPRHKLVEIFSAQDLPEPERDQIVDEWVANTRAKVDETGGAAFYMPSLDKIVMPPAATFLPDDEASAKDNFYSTLLHELTHWTGHKKRLDRLTPGGKNSESYAWEELVAELGSVMIGIQLGIQHAPRRDNAAYLKGWMSRIRNNPEVLFEAATAAGKALTYLNSLQPISTEKAA